MPTPNLLIICGAAFLAVLVVLTFLAAVMRILIALVPQRDEPSGDLEPAVVSAITSAAASAFPGTKVTRIEELK